jgi:hypothetical protein
MIRPCSLRPKARGLPRAIFLLTPPAGIYNGPWLGEISQTKSETLGFQAPYSNGQVCIARRLEGSVLFVLVRCALSRH